MARTKMNLKGDLRLSDYLSLGVMAEIIPLETIKEVLQETNKKGIRRRKLPSDLMMYYVISLALYSRVSLKEVLRCILEGMNYIRNISSIKIASAKSSISDARKRLGFEPLKLCLLIKLQSLQAVSWGIIRVKLNCFLS